MKNIAIITGATGGLGEEFVGQLISQVDEVWAIGRNVQKLSALEETFGSKVVGLSIDLSDVDNLEVVKARLTQGEYTVAYLVNNAGSGRMASSTEFSAEEIQKHITTHDTAMAILCNICIPYMGKGNYIINVASQAAFQPVPYINLYAASKAFCCSYSRSLNMELESSGITVTAACPGWIRTDLLQKELNGYNVIFPYLAEPSDVVHKTLRDVQKGKDMSVYSRYVRRMQFYSKFYPHRMIMRLWLRSIRKYINR